MVELTPDIIRALPKVALHEHLDGALRPATMLEIAAEVGHELPASTPDELGQWFVHSADSGELVRYLETFEHTTAVMQRAEDLRRVAAEFVADQAADGVVWVEARWAPEQHTNAGLTPAEAVRAVAEGLREGIRRAAEQGRMIGAGQIITAMRHTDRSEEIAALIDLPDALIVGFDIAGPEDGFPPSRHAAAFARLREGLKRITIHAGEAAGVDSIHEALAQGAQRLGHGVRIIEDVDLDTDAPTLGPVAQNVLDRQIALEICPTSNVQTGAVASLAEHPIALLHQLGFRVTVSCDNRLMGGITLSDEFALLVNEFGFDLDDLLQLTTNALESSFAPMHQRVEIWGEQILPGFLAAGLDLGPDDEEE